MSDLTPLPAAATASAAKPLPKVDPKNKDTAQSFEAVFLGQMTQLMLESVEKGDINGGSGEDMFRGVLAEKLGTEMARRGGVGIAPQVLEQILKLQQGQ